MQSFEKSLEKGNSQKLLNVVYLSAFLAFVPFKGLTQNIKNETKGSNVENIDPVTKEIKRKFVFDKNGFEETRKRVLEDRQWMYKYINSRKYKERLMREYKIWKSLGKSFKENNFLRSQKVAHVVFGTNKPQNINELIDGILKFKKELKNIKNDKLLFNKKFKLEDFFPTIDVIDSSEEDWREVEVWIRNRQTMLDNTVWAMVYPSFFHGLEGPGETIYGQYITAGSTYKAYDLKKPKNRGLVIISNTKEQSAYDAPLHEFAHGAEDADGLAIPSSVSLLIKRSLSDDPYLRDYSEIKVRLETFRRELQRLEIYDPFNEEFKSEHLEKYFDTRIKADFIEKMGVQHLIQILTKDDILWMMNNIAGVDGVDLDPVYRFYEREEFKSDYV